MTEEEQKIIREGGHVLAQWRLFQALGLSPSQLPPAHLQTFEQWVDGELVGHVRGDVFTPIAVIRERSKKKEDFMAALEQQRSYLRNDRRNVLFTIVSPRIR